MPQKSKSPKAFNNRLKADIPQIKSKKITLHNIYDAKLNRKIVEEKQGFQFWGCIVSETSKRTRHECKPANSMSPRSMKTRGQLMLEQYLKRRPNLKLIPYNLHTQQQQSNLSNRTMHDFKNRQQTYPINDHTMQSKYNEQDLYVLQEQMKKISHKSIYQMTPNELTISINWKKRFLAYFESRMGQIMNNPRKIQTVQKLHKINYFE